MHTASRRLATLLLLLAFSPPVLAADPCDPKSHQFDFWIGEWDVEAGGRPAGQQNRADPRRLRDPGALERRPGRRGHQPQLLQPGNRQMAPGMGLAPRQAAPARRRAARRQDGARRRKQRPRRQGHEEPDHLTRNSDGSVRQLLGKLERRRQDLAGPVRRPLPSPALSQRHKQLFQGGLRAPGHGSESPVQVPRRSVQCPLSLCRNLADRCRDKSRRAGTSPIGAEAIFSRKMTARIGAGSVCAVQEPRRSVQCSFPTGNGHCTDRRGPFPAENEPCPMREVPRTAKTDPVPIGELPAR